MNSGNSQPQGLAEVLPCQTEAKERVCSCASLLPLWTFPFPHLLAQGILPGFVPPESTPRWPTEPGPGDPRQKPRESHGMMRHSRKGGPVILAENSCTPAWSFFLDFQSQSPPQWPSLALQPAPHSGLPHLTPSLPTSCQPHFLSFTSLPPPSFLFSKQRLRASLLEKAPRKTGEEEAEVPAQEITFLI